MRRLDRLGFAQRVVLSIGLGMALVVLAAYVTSLGSPSANFGWFGYAPLTGNAFVPEGTSLSAWEQLLVWLGVVALWTIAALVIFKHPPAGEGRS